MIEYSKLQIGCMLIVIYIAFIYFRERYAYKVKKKEIVFELLLFMGIFSIAFDGITAYTVNRLTMAVADVFDAVSAKRCYRDAMPLEQCFLIIENGSGQDFDPYIADVFLDMKEMITNIVESN